MGCKIVERDVFITSRVDVTRDGYNNIIHLLPITYIGNSHSVFSGWKKNIMSIRKIIEKVY